MILYAKSIIIVKNSLNNLFRKSLVAGYTLVEVLVVVGLISVASAGAYLVVSGVNKDTADTKLQRDVATINRAIGVYQASGGSLADVSAPQDVLNRLKTRIEGDEAKQMAGLRGSLVDTRLKASLQTSAQASTNEQRAYWNAGTHAFYITGSGGVGVREFVLDESLASVDYGSAARASSFKLATVKPWIWDTVDGTAPTKAGPRRDPTIISTPGTPGNPGGPLQLRPPGFSRDGGEYGLTEYPLTLTLTNPNPPNSSNILYSINNGEWRVYLNDLLINPQETVKAMSATLIPDIYSDSSVVTKTYTTQPVTPEFELAFRQSSYSYVDLGGVLLPSNGPSTTTPVSGQLSLTNGNAIPDAYESSQYFQTQWIKDGSDPLTSTTATVGPNFTNGFTGQEVPITMDDFASSTQIEVKAGSVTKNPAVFNNSAVVTQKLEISVIKLLPPIITIDGKDVTLAFDFSTNQVPQGAYIYYTTDGSDPGVSGGRPAGGTAYMNAPFKLSGAAGSTVTVTARVYPPADYLNWFTASDTASESLQIPVGTEFYVGGNFVLPNGASGSGGPMRNIARLAGNGAVDSTFDVGSGASANSIVGVIRAVAAGSVFAGGDFESVNSVARPAVVRLNPNGSVDTSFDAGLAGGK